MLLDRLQRLLPRRYDATAAAFELRGGARFCAGLVEVAQRDVLDLGCSIGWFAHEAVARGARSVTGLDGSAGALEVARRSTPEAEFVEGDALDLPFADERFDVTGIFNLVEHIPRGTEPRLLAEAARVTRRGGVVALVTPHDHWLPKLTDPAWYLGHRHYRAEPVRALFAGAGIRVDRVAVGGAAADTADLLLYYLWRHIGRRERHPFEGLRRRADAEFDRTDGRNHLAVVGTRI